MSAIKAVKITPGKQYRSIAPLRVDLAGMSDFFRARGVCINACLLGLNAELFATTRDDDLVVVDAGVFGQAQMSLGEIYRADLDQKAPMFFKALQLYPGHRLQTGCNVRIDCQYGAGGLSTSSSVAGAIHAFLEHIFRLPTDPYSMVWRVIRTEPHAYGRQDQLAVVFGGINRWDMEPEAFNVHRMTPDEFHPERIQRRPLILCSGTEQALAESLFIYESGISGGADQILGSVAESFLNDPESAQAKFDRLNAAADELWDDLREHQSRPSALSATLGPHLNEIRQIHQELHSDVSNQRLEDFYETALKNGADGVRVCGAGGRGCILAVAPPDRHAALEAAFDRVDTPGPGSRKRITGKIQRFAGFDYLGARCWAAGF